MDHYENLQFVTPSGNTLIEQLSAQVEHQREQLAQQTLLINEMIDGFALLEITRDGEGKVDFRFLDVNPAFERLMSMNRDDIIGKKGDEVLPDFEESWFAPIAAVANTGIGKQFDSFSRSLKQHYSIRAYCPFPGQMALILNDTTKQKKLEEQLQYTQKMEAIWRLSDGISHDFNNLLTAIVGYSDMALSSLGKDSALYDMISRIKSAGLKSASLARQLLLFSHKKSLEMRVINLNTIVNNLQKLIRRFIGEDIELTMVLDPQIVNIKGDVAHIEQMLLNLVINARDAMPSGGKITLETKRVCVDKEYEKLVPEIKTGTYAMLSVGDSSSGKDSNNTEHYFDPLYPARDTEKRSELGLSIVFGIVKQHGGYVQFYRKPDRGATVKIYFPAEDLYEGISSDALQHKALLGGDETILLVEDEKVVRELTTHILKTLGYKVLTAAAPEKALALAKKTHYLPLLLVSDVIMPKMNGKDLFEQLLTYFPKLRVLFISGYTENVILQNGILNSKQQFLPKPFSVETFALKVREILDQ